MKARSAKTSRVHKKNNFCQPKGGGCNKFRTHARTLFPFLLTPSKMTSPSSKVLLVTGANRGIGYGIVRKAARDYRNSFMYSQSSLPLKIYLTSRDEEKGREAIEAIKAELKPDDLKITTIEYHQLDLNDEKSKDSIIDFLQQKEGGLDVL